MAVGAARPVARRWPAAPVAGSVPQRDGPGGRLEDGDRCVNARCVVVVQLLLARSERAERFGRRWWGRIGAGEVWLWVVGGKDRTGDFGPP